MLIQPPFQQGINMFGQRWGIIHRVLLRWSFYPLLLATILASVLIGLRIRYTRDGFLFWMVWNLFLAWLPYWGGLWATSLQVRYPNQWWRLVVPGLLWLLFLPNAPYMMTDLVHLNSSPESALIWYDVGVLATFAWIGCWLGVLSLRMMHQLVERWWGWLSGWAFVLGVLGLCGLGMYLGRVERWNSWDMLTRPRAVAYDIWRLVSQPLLHWREVGIILLFAAFMLMCYVTIPGARPEPAKPEGS